MGKGIAELWNPSILNQGTPAPGTQVEWDDKGKSFPSFLQEGSVGLAIRNLKMMLLSDTFRENFICLEEYKNKFEDAMHRLKPESGHWGNYLTMVIRIVQKSIPGLDVDGNFGPATQATVATLLGVEALQVLPMRAEDIFTRPEEEDAAIIEHLTFAKHPEDYTIRYDSKKRIAAVV